MRGAGHVGGFVHHLNRCAVSTVTQTRTSLSSLQLLRPCNILSLRRSTGDKQNTQYGSQKNHTVQKIDANKHQLSMTNPRATRCITAKVLQTSNVVAQCDKTCDRAKLTTLRAESRHFSATAATVIYTTGVWRLRWG